MFNVKKYLEWEKLYKKYKHWLKPEAEEQARVVLYLLRNWYTFTAIPNNTWTSSFKQKILNKITWLNPGLCDMLIILKRGSLLFIEMKLPGKILKKWGIGASPSKVSDVQKVWINSLGEVDNVGAIISFWSKEAIEKIKYYESL